MTRSGLPPRGPPRSSPVPPGERGHIAGCFVPTVKLKRGDKAGLLTRLRVCISAHACVCVQNETALLKAIPSIRKFAPLRNAMHGLPKDVCEMLKSSTFDRLTKQKAFLCLAVTVWEDEKKETKQKEGKIKQRG